MNAVSLTTDNTRARLDGIRERLARVRADRWSHVFELDGERMVATRVVLDRDGRKVGDEAPAVLCTFGPDSCWHEKEFFREAREDLTFVLELLTESGRMIREQRAQLNRLAPPDDGARVKNLSAEASIKCTEPAFQRYLSERHATADDGDLSDSALAASVLRRALGIGSRKDLNTDPEAAARWRAMRADFAEWMRG
jgi:hypothetical protein